MTIPIHLPATLVAGDSWLWRDVLDAIPFSAPEWSMSYVLRPVAGGDAVTFVGDPVDGVFEFRATATLSAGLSPGAYSWSKIASNSGTDSRLTVETGRVEILPDPTTATGDQRSSGERILDAIKSTLEGRVSKDAESYSIEGRSISRTPIADLLRLREVYTREVQVEQNPGASPFQIRRVKF